MLATPSIAAEFYKWRLPDGSIEYSDKPPVEGAERVELKPLVTYTPPAVSAPPATPEMEKAEENDGYDSFTITSPVNEAAIRDNAGNITVSFTTSPGLAKGHAINVILDGREVIRSTGGAVTLSDVSRGTHSIQAIIVDQSGAEIARTDSITVHLKRASSLF